MLGPLSGVQSMSWTETPAEAFRRRCEAKKALAEKEAHIRKCYKLMRQAKFTEEELLRMGYEENE